jgi:glycosyltransferase involved in cell wall biosynthesis
MSSPLISVIIPTWNREQYLREAIDSVLGQSYENREIIVVDDGSTDGTVDMVSRFGDRVLLLRQDNRGTGAARNAGIAQAAGTFLAFLDDDDVWADAKLLRQMQAFDDAPDTDAVYGHMEQFVSPEIDDDQRSRFRHLNGQVIPAPIAPAMLIRRASFDRVGPFDESLQIGVEIDWYARLCEAGLKTVMLDAVLYRRRLHTSNVNLTRSDEQPERLHVLKRIIDRRRKAAARPI